MKSELTGPITLEGIFDFIQQVHAKFDPEKMQTASLEEIFSKVVTNEKYQLKYIIASSTAYPILIRSKYAVALEPATIRAHYILQGYLGDMLGGRVLTDALRFFPYMPSLRSIPGVDLYVVATDFEGNIGDIEGFQIKI